MGDVKLLLASALADLDLASPARAAYRRWPATGSARRAPACRRRDLVVAAPCRRPHVRRGAPARPPTRARLSDCPALSRDGNLLALSPATAATPATPSTSGPKQIGGRDPIRLTTDDADDWRPAISADGTRVAFRSERSGGGIYVVPSLGGDAVLLAPAARPASRRRTLDRLLGGRESADLRPARRASS